MVGGAGNDVFFEVNGARVLGGPGDDFFRLWYSREYHIDGGEGNDAAYLTVNHGQPIALDDAVSIEMVSGRTRK